MSKSIAFFDVDYTLVDGSTGLFTTQLLLKYKILKRYRIFQAAYHYLRSKLFDPDVEKIYELAVADMAGTPLSRILEIGRECFEKDIRHRIFPDALKHLHEHVASGHRVVLLTAGPYMLIQALQEFLKLEESYSMGPEIVDGILVNRLQRPICHGEGKVHYAMQSIKQYGADLADCYFYTDDHSDLPLLEKVGNPRPVNPTRILRNVAMQRGWSILNFKR